MKEETENRHEGLIRTVFFTVEFSEFYESLNEKIQKKVDYVIELIKNMKVVHAEFVKKLVNTELYEMRVSVGSNEYRTIMFAVDHENLIEATEIIFLNGFLKKSTKDYNKQIQNAETILNNLEE